ncbi:MAG: ferritin [Desulfuromonadales bacterium GWD2_54_10]|nr:MAG: ferritin [Desulfuromonadales bacterium GWD2_54_10]
MNVFDFALRMELDGKSYYEKLAAETAQIGLKNIFINLAADEQKHYETIEALRDNTAIKMVDSNVLENTKNMFLDLIKDKSIVDSMRKTLDAYLHARKIEADSIRLYEDMAKKESNAEIAQVLQRIANEEKKHFNIMDNLYDYTLAPQNYLAWAEFSNLKEF